MVEVLEGVPVIGTVYGTIRKVLAGFGNPESRRAFQKFVLVRVSGVLTPAFLTGSTVLDRKDGTSRVYHAVYVPTNHLYLGNILILPEEDVVPTDIPVDEGIGIVLSAGATTPLKVVEPVPGA
jgi:uncharacterized membrane protein